MCRNLGLVKMNWASKMVVAFERSLEVVKYVWSMISLPAHHRNQHIPVGFLD